MSIYAPRIDQVPLHLVDDAPGASEGLHGPEIAVPGMRIRRVRLRSLAKIASAFFVLGWLVLVGTLIAIWNAAHAFGFIDTIEDTVTTSLGLDDPFTLAGSGMLPVVLVGAAMLMFFGLVLTLLLGLVYNVSCTVFGGLAIEVGPYRRRRLMFSWRHRGFVAVRE